MGDGQPSDGEIIRRCRHGEVEPFSLLVERYQDRVYNLAFRMLQNADDALDAAQDAFVRAFGALERFDMERPFAPWLFRILTNTCYGMLRKRRPELSFESIEAQDSEPARSGAAGGSEGDPQRHVLQTAREEEIQQAVLALSEPYRTVILLRYVEDMSQEAIAAALELPLGTVKTHLYRARRRLRQALSEGEDRPAGLQRSGE
jgi:RNA polymerase sigma-70 factor (ECF subfamily)